MKNKSFAIGGIVIAVVLVLGLVRHDCYQLV